jgi:hypothetical protein
LQKSPAKPGKNQRNVYKIISPRHSRGSGVFLPPWRGNFHNDLEQKREHGVMGGPGSGTWYRWDKRTTLDEVHRLDVRWLRKQGYLQPGVMAPITWHRGDRASGSITLLSHGDRLTLTYRYRVHGGDWDDVTQPVALDQTPCRYGGFRPWFLCPKCQRRVAVLTLYRACFWCRHCHRLPYASQQEGIIDRLWSQIRKLGQSVGAKADESPWMWRKPKGMHWRTFEQRVAKAQELEMVRDAVFSLRVEELLAQRHDRV